MNLTYLLMMFSVACEGVHALVCVRVTGAHVVSHVSVCLSVTGSASTVLLLLLLLNKCSKMTSVASLVLSAVSLLVFTRLPLFSLLCQELMLYFLLVSSLTKHYM